VAIFIAIAVLLGISSILVIRAAGAFVAAEAEAGTVTGAATVGSDATASAGQYVQFGGIPSGGGTGTGPTYYVDCSAGVDTNNGNSTGTAWKTLAKAGSLSYSEGSNLLLKRGCVFDNDTLTISSSGTSSNPITVGAYGSGNAPQITRNSNGADVTVKGSYVTVQDLNLTATPPSRIPGTDTVCPNAPVGNIQGVTFETGAANNTVKNTTISNMYAGVFLKAGSHDNHVLSNTLSNNDMMSPLDPGGSGDAGAFGILIWGNNNEIAYNAISGSNACSYDYILDGSAVEIFGGSSTYAASNNNIHHNKAVNDNAFTELGKGSTSPSPDNNVYAYNTYYASGISNAIFLVTRGSGDSYGPMTHTKFYNNTAYMTGTSKNGIYCGGTCGTDVLTFKNNIIATNNSTPIPNYSTADVSNNLGWVVGSSTNDPKFVNASTQDLHIQAGSPAIDRGTSESVNAGYNKDLDNHAVPAGAAVDIGAYEYGSLAFKASGFKIEALVGMVSTPAASLSRDLKQWVDNLWESGVSLFKQVGKKEQAYAGTSFTFAAVGDHAADSTTTPVLKKIGDPATRPDFFISLGDLAYQSYGSTSPAKEISWCKYVKDGINAGAGLTSGSSFGETYPFEIIGGGHENGLDNPDGLIDNFTQCLPNRMPNAQISNNGGNPKSTSLGSSSPLGSLIPSITGGPDVVTSNYGKEYYFDYPTVGPIARFIFAGPLQNYMYGGTYDFSSGTTHYNWLSNAIDNARSSGIKWVIVANHENFISMGQKSDEVGSAYFNLLVSKKVDLILQGHDHNYQRSKQLALGTGCSSISATSYNSSCISSSATSAYQKDQGSVLIINGSGGHGHYTLSSSDTQAPYFNVSDNTSFGFTRYTVTDTQISGTYIAASGGTFSDSFTITDSGAGTSDTTPPTVAITNPGNNQNISGTTNVTATASDNVAVSKVEFKVDGTVKATVNGSGPFSYSFDTTTLANGSHTIAATAYDAAGNLSTDSVTVVINNCAALPTAYGSSSVSANLPAAGTYHAWVRIMAPDTTNNSVYLQSDSGCGALMGDSIAITPNAWVWVDYKDGNSTLKNDITYATTGSHNLILTGNEPGVKIDRLLLLSDTCIPTGTGDNCTTTPDTTPPTVSITSPTTNSIVKGTAVNITANAADASGISKVDFYLDTTNLLSSDTTSPYAYTWDSTKVSVGSHTLTAKAYDLAGNVSLASVTVTVADAIAPSASINSPAANATVSLTVPVSLTSSDNVAVTKQELYLDTSTLVGAVASGASPTVINWDSTTASNGTHTLTAKAYDAGSNVGISSAVTLTVKNDTGAPTAPSNLTANAVSATKVDLSWSASSDDTAVAKYRIQRNGNILNEINAPTGSPVTYADTMVAASTRYDYVVYAIDSVGKVSPGSNLASVTTPSALDTIAPSSPVLSLVSKTSTQVNLSWTASTDTGGAGLAGYEIYRGSSLLAAVGPTVTTYGDGTVAAGQNYSYTVKAFDGVGNRSPASNTLAVTINKKGDINGDNSVSILDLSILLSNFGKTTAQASNPASDLDGNGTIGIIDLSILLSNFGT
jgi:parallel beta-helix repeat protein